MNSNHNYQIGKEHEVCEDYAVSGKLSNGANYAIVCDGCSASPDVDLGARHLALAAREVITNHVFTPLAFLRDKEVTPLEFSNLTLGIAKKAMAMFPTVNLQALDATLLVAWVHEKNMTLIMYGDGVFVHRTKESVNCAHINITSGAPDYISYDLDKNRKESYNKIESNVKEVEYLNKISLYKPFEPFVLNLTMEEGDTVSVISDGINSFKNADNTSIHWKDLVNEFTGFKNHEGEFAVRRLSAFKRKCAKDGIYHSDDISMASIYIS